MSVRGVTSSTVDTDEITRFNHLASGWWDSTHGGENAALHAMNRLRVPLIRDALIRQRATMLKSPSQALDSAAPLEGMTILDVGCGGGILSEVPCVLHYSLLVTSYDANIRRVSAVSCNF